MKKIVTLIIFLVIILLPITFYAQSKKIIKANNFFDAGEYFAARELYLKTYSKIKDNSQKAEISYKIGLCSKKLMDPQKCITWFRKAILYKYQDPMTHIYLAEAYKMRGMYEEASDYYEKYKELVPNDQRAEDGIKSCELSQKWIDNPSRYEVESIIGLNSRKNDFAPAMSADTNVIYFTSTRTTSSGENFNNNSGQNFADIFVSKKDTKGNWAQPTPIPGEVSSEFDDGSCTISNSGRTMYFTNCSVISDVNAGCKIYKSTLTGEQWSSPELVEIFADSSISVGQPALAPDELTLYFVSDNPNGSIGGKDIWFMKRKSKSDKWGTPKNMSSEINTKYNELYPEVDKEGNLYFSSDGRINMGGLDIYKAKQKKTGGWTVENLKSPINSPSNDFSIVFYKDDNTKGYFASSRNRAKGDDIFSFYLRPIVVNLKGYVINDANHAYIPDVDVEITGSDGSAIKLKTDGAGTFATKLNANVDYFILTNKKTYFKATANISTKGIEEEGKNFEKQLYMMPMIGIIKIPNIRYDFADTTLREESKVALDNLIEILKINKNVKIELRANTDFRGSEESNRILSQGRANSVVKYLVENGIKPERLVAKGYGENTPYKVDVLTAQKNPFLKEGDVLSENFINKLETEEEKEICHELNRRTEFTVISEDYENYESFGD